MVFHNDSKKYFDIKCVFEKNKSDDYKFENLLTSLNNQIHFLKHILEYIYIYIFQIVFISL